MSANQPKSLHGPILPARAKLIESSSRGSTIEVNADDWHVLGAAIGESVAVHIRTGGVGYGAHDGLATGTVIAARTVAVEHFLGMVGRPVWVRRWPRGGQVNA